MPPEPLKQLLRTSPFRPFRIVMTDGKTYDIPHPDFLWVGLSEAMVGLRGREDQGLWEAFDLLDLRHVIRAEPITAGFSSGTAE